MRGRDGGAERAGRRSANFADAISSALWTTGNLSSAVQLDVRRQIVRKFDGGAIGQVIFQSELVRGGVNLAEIIDTSVTARCGTSLNKIGNSDNQ